MLYWCYSHQTTGAVNSIFFIVSILYYAEITIVFPHMNRSIQRFDNMEDLLVSCSFLPFHCEPKFANNFHSISQSFCLIFLSYLLHTHEYLLGWLEVPAILSCLLQLHSNLLQPQEGGKMRLSWKLCVTILIFCVSWNVYIYMKLFKVQKPQHIVSKNNSCSI